MTDPRFSRMPVSRFDGQRGPNGRRLCRECGAEVPPRRQSYCSEPCADSWKEKWPSSQSAAVLQRDKGICESCGRDCMALLAELTELRAREAAERFPRLALDFYIPPSIALNLPRFVARCDELQLPPHHRTLTRRLWEMDHRVPVVEGGGSCGLGNLRTLCWLCHRRATRELAARRAERRRAEKAGAV